MNGLIAHNISLNIIRHLKHKCIQHSHLSHYHICQYTG